MFLCQGHIRPRRGGGRLRTFPLMLRSLELRFRGHSFAEQLALSRRSQACFLPVRLCLCQVRFRIPQRELKRSRIKGRESRAFLDLVPDVHFASDYPAEHTKAQDGFVTGFHCSSESCSSGRFRRDNHAEHRTNRRRRCRCLPIACRKSGDRA